MVNSASTTIGNKIRRRERVLGIDQGEKVIGVAVSDASWMIARPVGLIVRTTKSADFARILSYVTQFQAGLIVVGLPENPDPDPDSNSNANSVSDTDSDSNSNTAANNPDRSREVSVRRWASRLAATVEIPVVMWEEGFSTEEADRLLAEAGSRPKDYTTRIDDVAAAVILQGFLNEMAIGGVLPPPVKFRPGYDTLIPAAGSES